MIFVPGQRHRLVSLVRRRWERLRVEQTGLQAGVSPVRVKSGEYSHPPALSKHSTRLYPSCSEVKQVEVCRASAAAPGSTGPRRRALDEYERSVAVLPRLSSERLRPLRGRTGFVTLVNPPTPIRPFSRLEPVSTLTPPLPQGRKRRETSPFLPARVPPAPGPRRPARTQRHARSAGSGVQAVGVPRPNHAVARVGSKQPRMETRGVFAAGAGYPGPDPSLRRPQVRQASPLLCDRRPSVPVACALWPCRARAPRARVCWGGGGGGGASLRPGAARARTGRYGGGSWGAREDERCWRRYRVRRLPARGSRAVPPLAPAGLPARFPAWPSLRVDTPRWSLNFPASLYLRK